MPQYFRVSTPTTNYLNVDMPRPVSKNSTATLRCYTEAAQNKFTIGVTSPSGAFFSDSSKNTNPTSFSLSYRFTETGLYKIDCYSKTTASSTAQVVTFYVLCYAL